MSGRLLREATRAWSRRRQRLAGDGARPVNQYRSRPSFPDTRSATGLERLLDEQADDRPAVRAAYRRAMHLELAFFDAALLPSG